MRSARVKLERRLDGSRWKRWRNRIIPPRTLERARVIVKPPAPARAIPERNFLFCVDTPFRQIY